MFYRNGSSEARAMGYDAAYQAATTNLTTDDMRVCSDDLVGPLNPWSTWGWAEFGGAEWSDYWDERRHLPDVLANYQGSVYIMWGCKTGMWTRITLSQRINCYEMLELMLEHQASGLTIIRTNRTVTTNFHPVTAKASSKHEQNGLGC